MNVDSVVGGCEPVPHLHRILGQGNDIDIIAPTRKGLRLSADARIPQVKRVSKHRNSCWISNWHISSSIRPRFSHALFRLQTTLGKARLARSSL